MIIIVAVGIYTSGKIRNRIASGIQSYEEIDVDLFQQQIEVKGVEFRKAQIQIKASKVHLDGLHYWDYIMNDRLIIDKVDVEDPEVTVVSSNKTSTDSSKTSQRDIQVKTFNLYNGTFRMKKNGSAGNEVYFRFPEAGFSEVKIDSATRGDILPFKYSSYEIKGDSVAIKMNPEHSIAAEEFSIVNGKTAVRNFSIVPNYKRKEFDQKIPYEKDRISLVVEKIELDSLNFSLENDTLHLKNPVLSIAGANLQIYRNKLLPDDVRRKSLLGEKLRNSPVKLNFEQVKVSGSKIDYEEKVKETEPPAKVIFTEIEGTVENLVNVNMSRKDFPRTRVKAGALFMNKTSVSMDWSFNVTNSTNKFVISGKFGTVPAEILNSILKPSLGIEAEGKLQSVSFTFTGNEDAAVGDVRVNYDRFKINVMQKDGRKKNKLLSVLANLFVDNDGLTEERTKKVEFTRDKTKSFWNYMWKGLRKGVIDALSQL